MRIVHILGASHPMARYLYQFTEKEYKIFLYSSKKSIFFNNIEAKSYEDIHKYYKKDDVIISLSPINKVIKLVNSLILKNITLSKCIFISSTSVYSKINSNSIDKNLFIHFKNSEENLENIYQSLKYDSNFIVLRTTMLWGDHYDKNIEFIHHFISKYRFFPLSSNPLGLRSPLHYEDLAMLLRMLLPLKINGFKVFDVTGDEDISFINLVKLIKKFIYPKRIIFFLKIPTTVIKAIIFFINLFPRNKFFAKISYPLGFLDRQSDDLVFRYNDIKNYVGNYCKDSFEDRLKKLYEITK